MKPAAPTYFALAASIALAACSDDPQMQGTQRRTLPRTATGDGSNSTPVNPLSSTFQQQTYQQQVGSVLPGSQTSGTTTAPSYSAPSSSSSSSSSAFNDQIATAASNVFSSILGGLFSGSKPTGTSGSSSSGSSTTPTTTASTTTTTSSGSTTTSPATTTTSSTTPVSTGPSVVTGSDACNDPANNAFPAYPAYKITRKDGYMTVEFKSISSNGYATTGTPITRFAGSTSPDYQAMFQSGYIYKGASQYSMSVHLGFVASGGTMKAVVSWTDGSLKYVGDVEGYSAGMALPKILTVRFGHGACLVQYGASDGLVSGGAGYLLIP